MNPEEIRQLTSDAEAGLGCKVAEKIQAIPLAEREDVFRQMKKLNAEDTAASASVPKLNVIHMPLWGDTISEISRNPQGSFEISRQSIFESTSPENTVVPTLSGIAQLPEFSLEAEGEFGSYELKCKSDLRK